MALKVFRAVMPHVICIFSMLLAAPRLSAGNFTEHFIAGVERFGNNMFAELAPDNSIENVAISPFFVHTGLTMTHMGAEGQTADELDKVLSLSSQNPTDLANNYHAILAKYESSNVLKVANKIYAMTGYSVRDTFNQLLTKKFYSKVDSINFAKNEEAAHTINSWVEKNTNNQVKDIVNEYKLDAGTRLVLVNGLHFNCKWVYQSADVYDGPFYVDETRNIRLPIVVFDSRVKYAKLDDLDAEVVELPLADSDVSMLVILPKTRTGRKELEHKLKAISLADINKRMRFEYAVIRMPKMKVEFESELSKPLFKMGIERMFSPNAELGKMVESGEGLKVSSVRHKVVFEISAGDINSEETGTTFLWFNHLEFYKFFTADRPFYYVLKNKDNLVLLQGNYKSDTISNVF